MKPRKETVYISYADALDYYGRPIIRCNRICEHDWSIYENSNIYSATDEDEEGTPPEIFQYFVTGYTDDEVSEMNRRFPGVFFGYSDNFELYVLLVTHFGTSWDYVPTECVLEEDENSYFNEWATKKAKEFENKR